VTASSTHETFAAIQVGTSVSSVSDWLRSITVRIIGRGHSLGSGVVWNSSGLIVTNAHVAIGRTHSVELSDGQCVQARTVARDPRVDLAALTVNLPGPPAAVVRSARGVRPGELVIAIGNPWDGDGAVSTGIVHRAAAGGAFLFASIRLAPGNSGGPLADSNGFVIGINSAIVGGLGCAVTSDTVQEFLRRHVLESA
jgi:serine protease Do